MTQFTRFTVSLFCFASAFFILFQDAGLGNLMIEEYHGMFYLMIALFFLGIWHIAIFTENATLQYFYDDPLDPDYDDLDLGYDND